MSETGFRMFTSFFSAGAELTYAVLFTAFSSLLSPPRADSGEN